LNKENLLGFYGTQFRLEGDFLIEFFTVNTQVISFYGKIGHEVNQGIDPSFGLKKSPSSLN